MRRASETRRCRRGWFRKRPTLNNKKSYLLLLDVWCLPLAAVPPRPQRLACLPSAAGVLCRLRRYGLSPLSVITYADFRGRGEVNKSFLSCWPFGTFVSPQILADLTVHLFLQAQRDLLAGYAATDRFPSLSVIIYMDWPGRKVNRPSLVLFAVVYLRLPAVARRPQRLARFPSATGFLCWLRRYCLSPLSLVISVD